MNSKDIQKIIKQKYKQALLINGANYCLPQSIVKYLTYFPAKFNEIFETTFPAKIKLAEDEVFHYSCLMSEKYLKNKSEKYNKNDLQKLTQKLGINIIVVDIHDQILYISSEESGNPNFNTTLYSAYLILHDSHYYAVLKKSNHDLKHIICPFCYVRNTNNNHQYCCKTLCSKCQFTRDECKKGKEIECKSCNRTLNNQLCFNNHINSKICDLYPLCNLCHHVIDLRKISKENIKSTKEAHRCYSYRCCNCHTNVELNTIHQCPITPTEIKFNYGKCDILFLTIFPYKIGNKLEFYYAFGLQISKTNTSEFINFKNMLSLLNYISQRDELLVITFHGASIDFPLIMEDLIWNSNEKNWSPLIVKNKIISILMKKKHIRLIDIENFITTTMDKLVSAFDELKGIQLNYLPYQLVMNKFKKYPMIWDKKYFNYSKFPENLSEDPSQRYTKVNFDKWWDSVDKTQEQTIFQYVGNLAKTSLNILAKSTNIYRERIKNIYHIDILDFLTK